MKKIGIYNPNLHTKGGGEKVCLALAEVLARDNHVTLISHKKVNIKELERYFGVDLSKVRLQVITPSPNVARMYNRGLFTEAVRRIYRNRDLYGKIKKFNYDIFVNNAFNTDLPSPAPIGVYMCMFPSKLPDRDEMGTVKKAYASSIDTANRSLMHPDKVHWLDTYSLITANSVFTQTFIKKYWNRDSMIIYPICDSMFDKNAVKRKTILNVGRFFQNDGIQHHKRQDFLLDTFLKMPELHDEWQLHFAGTVNHNAADFDYILDLMRRAEGFPVYFHYDIKRERLKELYGQANIYWHATGFGSDPEKSPERQEHFGISTVEAMSAGAIPVVIATAGQEEVVTEGVDGYLWKTEKGLIEKTQQAITNGEKLRDKVMESAARFDKDAFAVNVKEVFEAVLSN